MSLPEIYTLDITKNFTLLEFIKSDTATKNKVDNVPKDISILNNIIYLVKYFLQPVRDHLGLAITVSSGYRCKALNSLVGGSASSSHMEGLAVDFNVQGFPQPSEHFPFITNQLKGIAQGSQYVFDQLILEPTWIHLGVKPKGQVGRKEVLDLSKK